MVGVGDWQMKLENNKVAFTQEFVSRTRFVTSYPTTLTPAEYVDGLFMHAAVTPSAAERTSVINEFGGAATSADPVARARALRRVAENSTLNEQETNKAFVLMQYFGYLRRNPNDSPDADYTGYDFWLTKLNEFNGNFVNAEMVKAFIVSGEYRQRLDRDHLTLGARPADVPFSLPCLGKHLNLPQSRVSLKRLFGKFINTNQNSQVPD